MRHLLHYCGLGHRGARQRRAFCHGLYCKFRRADNKGLFG
jgi:hypothetical protein